MGWFDFLMVADKAPARPANATPRGAERRTDRRFSSPIFKVKLGTEEGGETVTWSMGGLEIRGLRQNYVRGTRLNGYLGRGDSVDGDFTAEVVDSDRNIVRVRMLSIDPRLRNTLSRLIGVATGAVSHVSKKISVLGRR
jgi:hypothetical protein